jgi:GWxTD domain-containing protein
MRQKYFVAWLGVACMGLAGAGLCVAQQFSPAAADALQAMTEKQKRTHTVENEFKEEHYRRIAYANEHFTTGIPGWKTDRGRVYIVHGPPDEIDDHSSDSTAALPFVDWTYRHLDGIGDNVKIEFRDITKSGEFHMFIDPKSVEVPGPALQEVIN